MPRWERLVAGLLALLVAGLLLLAAALGGLHADTRQERALALGLALVTLGGALAAWTRPDRLAATGLLAVLAVWIAWTAGTAPDAMLRSAPWWAALAVAAGLAWRR